MAKRPASKGRAKKSPTKSKRPAARRLKPVSASGGSGGTRQAPKQRTVQVHLHGAAQLLKKIGDDGHAEALAAALKGAKPVAKLDRKTFDTIHDLVKKTPSLRNDATVQAMFNCDPNDPYDICW
jgi:hypothetical protein